MLNSKKLLLSGAVILAVALYVVRSHLGLRSDSISLPATDPNTVDVTSSTPTGAGTFSKNGTFTGSVADAYYGLVQVQAVISNGKLTNVVFLQYPNDRRESVQINDFAIPRLRQEAIAAQSASVNIISGATQSSEAFRESLTSALSKAS